MFSDKCTLQQFVVRIKNVRRPISKGFEERYTVSTMKPPPSHKVWGAFFRSNTAGLYFLLPGSTINSSRYVKLLEEKFKILLNIHQETVFMHDGAPCHRFKAVKQSLAKKRLATLDSSANSPGLNILRIYEKWIADKQSLSAGVIKEQWVKEISKHYCEKLISSILRRIHEVIESKGRHTKY